LLFIFPYLVPDNKQSPLEATVVKNQWSLPFCKNKWDYFDVWFKVKNFKRFIIECWAVSFRLHYDPKTKKSYPTPGVTVRPKDFGSVYEIEKNVLSWVGHEKDYAKYIVEALVGLGYIKNQNLLAATYDWRFSPQDNPNFHEYFSKLIEVTYSMNQKRSVILTCHGSGCLYTHYFLKQQHPHWKANYVKALIAIGAPWGGSFHDLYTYLDTDDDTITSTFKDVRYVERTFSSTAYLLPQPHVFAGDALIQTLFRNYSSNDYKDLFTGLGYPNAYNMWSDSYPLTSNLKHPGVDVFIMNGIGFKTMEAINYRKAIDVNDEKNTKRRTRRKIIYGNGDGKVNLKSARRCLEWQTDKFSKYYKFHYTEFLANHDNLIKETHPVSHFLNIVASLKFDHMTPSPEVEPHRHHHHDHDGQPSEDKKAQ